MSFLRKAPAATAAASEAPVAATTRWQFLSAATREWTDFHGADSSALTDAHNDGASSVTLTLNGDKWVVNMAARSMAMGGSDMAFQRHAIAIRSV